MLIVYLSVTGQTRKFVNKLGMKSFEITPDSVFTEINEPYIVIAPTYEKEATEIIDEFIDYKGNKNYLKGVAGGGNRNFDSLYCFTAKDLSNKYSVPLLMMFEFQGSQNDVKKIKQAIKFIESKKGQQVAKEYFEEKYNNDRGN